MDPSSFDRLSRLLARATTRRGAIAAVVAGLAGVAGVDPAAAIPPQCTAGGATCTKHSQCCSSTCRLVGGGGVRRVCDCEAGTARCGGRCVRIDTAERCGSCDVSCKAGEQCCNGKCRAVKTDEANCGACGVKCAAGQTCCKGVCVDLDTSKGNCGACGKACTGSRICCDGACLAGGTDENNCGACGNVCAAGETCCGGACVDLDSDERNCGRCNKRCSDGLICGGGTCFENGTDAHCGPDGEPCAEGTYCVNEACVPCTVVAPGSTTLAAAIAANPTSDAFCLQAGTYVLSLASISRPLTLNGKGDSTIFDTSGYYTIDVYAPVRIQHLKSQGGFFFNDGAAGSVVDHVTLEWPAEEIGTSFWDNAEAIWTDAALTVTNTTITNFKFGVFSMEAVTLNNVTLTNCERALYIYEDAVAMDAASRIDGSTTYAVWLETANASFTNNGGSLTNNGGACPNNVKLPDNSCCTAAGHLQTGTCPAAGSSSLSEPDRGKGGPAAAATPEATQSPATPEAATPAATAAPTDTPTPEATGAEETPPPATPGA